MKPRYITSITNAPLLAVVLYLLDMHHQPGEVHVIMEYRMWTLIFQISIDSCEEPTHIVPTVRYKESSIPG